MKKVNRLIYRVVAILFVCVLASTSILCGLFARYTTSSTSTDHARVAMNNMQIEILKEGHIQPLYIDVSEINPGETFNYYISLVNFRDNGYVCEVAMEYDIQLETFNALPLQFQLIAMDNSQVLMKTNSNNTKHTWGVGNFEAGVASTQNYQLQIAWPSENDIYYADEIDLIEIIVDVEQID